MGVVPGDNPGDNERVIVGYANNSPNRTEFSIFDEVTGALLARRNAVAGYGIRGYAGDGYGVALNTQSASTSFPSSSGSGDNSVAVGVDAYGSFGSQVLGATTDSVFDL